VKIETYGEVGIYRYSSGPMGATAEAADLSCRDRFSITSAFHEMRMPGWLRPDSGVSHILEHFSTVPLLIPCIHADHTETVPNVFAGQLV